MGDSVEASPLFRQLARPKPRQQVIQPATPDAMSLDPHRASVVVDLLESATRAGSLEKKEAAAILSSWIDEQKQVRSDSSSPGPDSETTQAPPPQPPQPPPPPLQSPKTGPTSSTTMTVKTTTMTTTTSQSQTPLPPAQLPGSPSVAINSNVGTLKDAAASLTPKSIRRLSRQLTATSKHCSMPNTPTAASASRQFSFSASQQASSKETKTTTSTATTNAADGRKTPQQRQRRRSQQQLQQHHPTQPMRSLFHVFASCAIGERGSDESGESDSAARRRRRTELGNIEPVQHRFFLDPLPPPPPPPPPPPAPPMPPPSLAATLPPRPASSTSSDPQVYALYDPAGAEQNTYCYIDESDLADLCLPAPAADAAATESEAKKTAKETGWSPSGTSDSGMYGSGLKFETADNEAVYN